LCYAAATASLVLFLVRQAGLPPALFGTFLLTGAAGGVLGSFFAARLNRRLGLGLTMACANLLTCLALLSVGLFPILWVSAVAFFVSSFALLNWNVLIMTLRQSLVPGALLGRVHGTWRTLLWGTMPLGSVIGGLLARIDLALPFQLAGGASALAAVVFFRFLTTLPNAEDVDNGDHPDAQFGLGAEAGLPGLPLED
jgi:MFS family permease